MCTFIAVIISLAAADDQRVNPNELAQARTALQGRFNKISSLRLVYSEEWSPSAKSLAKEAERRQREIDRAPAQVRKQLIEDFKKSEEGVSLSRQIELLYAYPLMRVHQNELSNFSDGTSEQREFTVYIDKDKRTVLDKTGKQLIIDTPEPVVRYPLHSLGMRMPNSVNMPVTDLLVYPELTYELSPDEINGAKTVVWRIGPGIPKKTRVHGWNDDTTVTVWLGKDSGYQLHRIEIALPKDRFYRLSCADFHATVDLRSRRQLPFPRTAVFEDGGGMTTWTIKTVEINPSLTSEDFRVKAPPDMFVLEHGKPKRLSGGKAGRADLASTAAVKAKDLLDSVPSNRQEYSGYIKWTWVVPIFVLGVVLGLFTYQWRKRNVSSST